MMIRCYPYQALRYQGLTILPLHSVTGACLRMVNLFKTLIGGWAFIKSLDDNGVVVDSEVEKLHYKFTAGALFLSTTLLGMSEMFGKPIQCLSNIEDPDEDKEEQMNKAVTQWCFVQGTYTICNGINCDHLRSILPAQG